MYLNGGGAGGRATFHLGTAVGPIGPIGPAGAGKFFSMAPPMGTACSSEGSHDSHNDSGYCVRPGGGSISGGPSPSLSGNMRTVNERNRFFTRQDFFVVISDIFGQNYLFFGVLVSQLYGPKLLKMTENA